jgi:hypothetical protein
MAAACTTATKKMATKNLEMNMDVGDASTGWLVSSKGIHPRFYIFLRAQEARCWTRFTSHDFQNRKQTTPFVEVFHGTPPPLPSPALLLPSLAASVCSLSSFSLHVAGNPISGRKFRYPGTFVDAFAVRWRSRKPGDIFCVPSRPVPRR